MIQSLLEIQMASDSTAKKLDPDNIRDVKAAFEQFDQNHNGFITSDEMKECLRLSKIAFKNDEVDEVISKMDKNKDGQVSFEEYLVFMSFAAGGQIKQYRSKHKK